MRSIEMKGLLSSIIMGFLILQWNARSLISNGQEFKRYIEKLDVKPEIICIQETWMKSHLDFKIVGYNSVRLVWIGMSGRQGDVQRLLRKEYCMKEYQ